MFNALTHTKNILVTLTIGGLISACASVTDVKEVTADKIGYLSKKFSPQSLSPAIVKKLPVDHRTANFGRFTITIDMTSQHADGKSEAMKSVATYIDNGNGFVQRMSEVSNNDIVFSLNYSLTYKGLADLKWQQVPLGRSTSDMLYEVKDISRFDAIPSAADKEFEVNFTSGIEPQLANFFSFQKTCKTTRQISASAIHVKLPGQALEIDCQLRRDNAVVLRTKHALLLEYGVAIQLEDTTSLRKTIFQIVDVSNQSKGPG